MTGARPNPFIRAKNAAVARWHALEERRPAVAHVAAAWRLLADNNGTQYSAAITYFSFLALFPLLLLAVAVSGFVLHAHPAAQQDLLDHITSQIPGDLGQSLHDSVSTLIARRTSVGIVALVGVAVTGLGWIGNLRAAVDGVWGRQAPRRSFVGAKLANLFVLAGLGIGIMISLGITVVGTALTDQVLRASGLDHVAGSHNAVVVLGLVLADAGDVLIFWWVLIRLPDISLPRRVGWQGALLAAVGFEVLKVIGTITIAKFAHSPTAGPFAGLLAVLIWIELVARYLLFCTAWTATSRGSALGPPERSEPARGGPGEPDEPTAAPPEPDARPAPDVHSPMAVVGSLLAAGAVVGAAASWLTRRRRDRGDADPTTGS